MDDEQTFKNHFLIAMPSMEDEHFEHSVTLLCEHNDNGALGLIVNRPSDLSLADMFKHLELPDPEMDADSIPVFYGGPVQPERGFVIHRTAGNWQSSLPLGGDLHLTTSKDILSAIGKSEGPKDFLLILGYSGWSAGQLENEMLQNAWLNTPANSDIIFHTPSAERWEAATRLLGISSSQIMSQTGHA